MEDKKTATQMDALDRLELRCDVLELERIERQSLDLQKRHLELIARRDQKLHAYAIGGETGVNLETGEITRAPAAPVQKEGIGGARARREAARHGR